jgi:hypothetical protein
MVRFARKRGVYIAPAKPRGFFCPLADAASHQPVSESVKSLGRPLLFLLLFAVVAACAFYFSSYFPAAVRCRTSELSLLDSQSVGS